MRTAELAVRLDAGAGVARDGVEGRAIGGLVRMGLVIGRLGMGPANAGTLKVTEAATERRAIKLRMR